MGSSNCSNCTKSRDEEFKLRSNLEINNDLKNDEDKNSNIHDAFYINKIPDSQNNMEILSKDLSSNNDCRKSTSENNLSNIPMNDSNKTICNINIKDKFPIPAVGIGIESHLSPSNIKKITLNYIRADESKSPLEIINEVNDLSRNSHEKKESFNKKQKIELNTIESIYEYIVPIEESLESRRVANNKSSLKKENKTKIEINPFKSKINSVSKTLMKYNEKWRNINITSIISEDNMLDSKSEEILLLGELFSFYKTERGLCQYSSKFCIITHTEFRQNLFN